MGVLGPLTVAHGQGTRGVFITRTLLRITGDLASAALLSQLIYWFDTGRGGSVRAGVRIPHRPGGGEHLWLAKADGEWWDECGVTAKQASRIGDDLVAAGLVATEKAKFNGRPCRHWRIIPDALEEAIRAEMVAELEVRADSPSGRNDSTSGRDDSPAGENGLALRGESITETFTDTLTTESVDLNLPETSGSPAGNRADVAVGAPCPAKPITAKWKGEVVELGDWSDPIQAVFEMWVVVFEKNRSLVRLNAKRRNMIREAIKTYGDGDEHRGVAVCLSAIRGATLDAFYAERKREYGDPEHLFRIGQKAATRNNVEYFAGLWEEFMRTGTRPPQASSGRRNEPQPAPDDIDGLAAMPLVDLLRRGLPAMDVIRVGTALRERAAVLSAPEREMLRRALEDERNFPRDGFTSTQVDVILADLKPRNAERSRAAAADLAAWGAIPAPTEPLALPGGTTQ